MHGTQPQVFWKVNVEGTKSVIAVAVAKASQNINPFSGHEGTIDIDERLPYITEETAHDSCNFIGKWKRWLTHCCNPPRGYLWYCRLEDRQNFEGLAEVIRRGHTKWQIGDTTNLFDWIYMSNVAKVHLLSVDRLGEGMRTVGLKPAEDILDHPLPSIIICTDEHRVPTSSARLSRLTLLPCQMGSGIPDPVVMAPTMSHWLNWPRLGPGFLATTV